MTVVVDASFALKWALPEQHTREALALWDRWQASSEQVIAPPIFRSEVTNVLHVRARRGHLARSDASEILDFLISTVEISEPAPLYQRAFAMASEFHLGAAYDALYLALAESRGCEVWTADLKLVRSVQGEFGLVRWLGESV